MQEENENRQTVPEQGARSSQRRDSTWDSAAQFLAVALSHFTVLNSREPCDITEPWIVEGYWWLTPEDSAEKN